MTRVAIVEDQKLIRESLVDFVQIDPNNGSPATEAPPSQAPLQSTDVLLSTTAGGKSAADPVELARAGEMSPASAPEDTAT